MGKRVKVDSLHLTLGTLLLHPEEIEKIKMELKEITEQFVQMRGSTLGLVVTFMGVEYGDGGTVWAEVYVGGQAIKMFREMLEDKFSKYLTDLRFHAHLTVYKGIEATDEMKERFRASSASTTLTPINLVVATLRERKTQGQDLKPPLVRIPLGSNLKDIEIAERKKTMGGVMKA